MKLSTYPQPASCGLLNKPAVVDIWITSYWQLTHELIHLILDKKWSRQSSPPYMDIAKEVIKYVPAEIVVTESNDPRSYRLNSDKLLKTGFKPKYRVLDGIREIIEVYNAGKVKNEDNCYNIKTMKKIDNLN